MTLDIACGATANYVPHLAAMLHSLLLRTHERPLRIWLMATPDDLPAAEVERLTALVAGHGGALHVLQVPPALQQQFPAPRHFHASIWHRVLLPELLPQLDRVLYLDADMIVTDDLAPLMRIALGAHLFGAVVAPLYRSQPRLPLALGLPRVEDYVSSGVLLMDLARMRAEGVVAQVRAYAALHPDNPCPEQDALNALFHRRCLRLHPRWNAQPIFFDTPAQRLPFPPGVAQEAVARPAIVHFAGVAKPWHFLSRHPLRALYFEHLRQTPWPVRPLEGRTLLNRLLRPLPPHWMYCAFRGIDAWRAARQRLQS